MRWVVRGVGLPLDVLAQPVVRPEDLRRAVPSPDEGQEAPGPTLLSGFDDIYEGLQERVAAPGCHALALRDNYPFWKRHNERSHAGKLMLVDPADTSMLHIFLDDNIGATPTLPPMPLPLRTAHSVDACMMWQHIHAGPESMSHAILPPPHNPLTCPFSK